MHWSPATLEAQFCLSFNESGSFSSLCSLYSVPLSLSSALSGPLVYTGIPESAPAAGGCINRVPFRDRMRGGESERGRYTTSLGEAPPFIPSILAPFFLFEVLKSQRNLDMLLGIQFAPQVDQKGVVATWAPKMLPKWSPKRSQVDHCRPSRNIRRRERIACPAPLGELHFRSFLRGRKNTTNN